MVLVIGSSLLATLLSVRSWFKPTININDISPATVVLREDKELIDFEQTQEARNKAKFEVLKNVKNEEIFSVNTEMTNQNFENLKLVVQVIRNKIHNRDLLVTPINPKVSLEVQDLLLSLSDEKYNQITLSANLKTTIDKYFAINSDFNPDFRTNLVEELDSLNEVERKYFFENLTTLRQQKIKAMEITNALGKEFFALIKTLDYEATLKKAFIVQKKLLDLGIVMGMPRTKVHQNIHILYPTIPPPERMLIEKIIDVSTNPNIQIDWSKVFELEMKAMTEVKPIKVTLKKGSLLAEKGKVVDVKNYHFLKQLNMLRLNTDYKEIQSNFYWILFFVFFTTIAMTLSKWKKYTIPQLMAVFSIPVTVLMVVAVIAIWGVDKLALAPIATIPILLTIFYMPSMAILMTTLVCFFLVKTMDMSLWQVLPQYVGSMYSIILSRRVHQREDLSNAGLKIALAQVFVFLLTVTVALENFHVMTVVIIASFYMIGAIASGFLALALVPYIESSIKLVTPFKLAELSNPNQPLLVLLKQKAPGTYEHSLNVTRFSEEAGQALGLNTDLIRVGLIYHDIGKTYAPDYFIENTLGKPNPHTTLGDPQKSAEIIIAHVPEGVKLAKKYNLPDSIINFIPMHQGTTVTNFFYHKAVERFGKENVNADDFRYPGPIPNSKETGIAMIADSVEAALKSIRELVDETKAKEMIEKIVQARLDEGELRLSGLSKSDLTKAKEAFFRVWKRLNHERVKYPG